MKGDFTRFSFRASKHYTEVLKQQGRVELDADWNEQVQMQSHLERIRTRDLIGPCGVPEDYGGFEIVPGNGLSFSISPGRIYVDGILCEMEPNPDADPISNPRKLVDYMNQTDYLDAPGIANIPEGGGARKDLVYLDVWQRHMTIIEDPGIQEKALGGPDTTTRIKTICQVKVRSDVHGSGCKADEWKEIIKPSEGRLSTRAVSPPPSNDLCKLASVGGYSGLENRLYRVEVHDPEDPKTGTRATFKWSRDNGSVVFSVKKSSFDSGSGNSIVTLNSLGRDQILTIREGDWVEVIDDITELSGKPGTMAKVLEIDDAQLTLTLNKDASKYDTADDTGDGTKNRHPKVRRWDQASDAICVATGSWVDLEDGIQIEFSGDNFKTGDYWTFTARTANGKVDELSKVLPQGIKHHYCELAVISWQPSMAGATTGVNGTVLCDCRKVIRPLTNSSCCMMTVGDGVSSFGDFSSIQKAIDAITGRIGCGSGGGTVCILPGVHKLDETVTIKGYGREMVGSSLEVPPTAIIISGCGPQTRIIGPVRGEGPAFQVENCISVYLKSFYLELQRGQDGIAIENSKLINLSDCFVVRPHGDIVAQPDIGHSIGSTGIICSNPISIHDSHLVRIDDNIFEDGDATIWSCIPIESSSYVTLSKNKLVRVSIWVQNGSSRVAIQENLFEGSDNLMDISKASDKMYLLGPGVALGGGSADESKGKEIIQVDISGNEISNSSSSGISTISKSGFISKIIISSNRILKCAQKNANEFFDAEVVGGIVLRDVEGLEVRDNYIIENGIDNSRPACGIFTSRCKCVDIADNIIIDNGKVKEDDRYGIDFGGSGLSGSHSSPWPDPSPDSNLTISTTDQSKEIVVNGSGNLVCGRPVHIDLLYPAQYIELTFSSSGDRANLQIADENKKPSLLIKDYPGTNGTMVITGILPIKTIDILPHSNGTPMLKSLYYVPMSTALQAGVVIDKVISMPYPPTDEAAARVHGNTIACPRGPALLMTGLGPMSVADNNLSSQGIRGFGYPLEMNIPSSAAKGLLSLKLTLNISNAVLIANLGISKLPPGNMMSIVNTGVHLEGSKEISQIEGALTGDGRVIFHGNQVSLGFNKGSLASAFIASLDDISLQNNQFNATLDPNSRLFMPSASSLLTSEGSVPSIMSFNIDIAALAQTIRATGNRFRETIGEDMKDFPSGLVVLSYISFAFMNLTANNQADNCILATGLSALPLPQNIRDLNQIWDDCPLYRKAKAKKVEIIGMIDELKKSLSSSLVASALNIAATLEDNWTIALKENANRLEKLGSDDPRVTTIRHEALAADRLGRQLHRRAEIVSLRPDIKPEEWAVYGRVLHRDGTPANNMTVRISDASGKYNELLKSTGTDEDGRFSLLFLEKEIAKTLKILNELHVVIENLSGTVLCISNDSISHSSSGRAEYFDIVLDS
jgi:hypothetical protein